VSALRCGLLWTEFPFEACSGFTHITARWIAQPPDGDFCHEASLPTRAARQLPDQPTIFWVEPSSTGYAALLRKKAILKPHNVSILGWSIILGE
jgi:hypothetical protein